MLYFSDVQSNNAPREDEGEDESNLDDQKYPDEFDDENGKGLEIRTMIPCKMKKYIFHDKKNI